MTRQFSIVYELFGGRGRVFVSTLSRAGACRLFLSRFPAARVVRMVEVSK